MITIESLMEHTNFPVAVANYCERMTQPASPGWPIRKFLNQIDRYYGCYVLIGLFYAWQRQGGPAPTLARLQAESRLSRRQTASLVQTLSAAALVVMEGDSTDGRQKILKPQPPLIAEVGRSCAHFVDACDRVTGQHLFAAIEDAPDALGNLISRSIAVIRNRHTVIREFPRVLAASGFDCGYLLLVGVMHGHYCRGSTGRMLTYADMAERFQVSPSHIANVFTHFRQDGILSGQRRGVVQPDFRAEFEHFCAAEMAHYARLLQ